MSLWTLVYTPASGILTEQTFADWGISTDLQIEIVNKGRDTLTLQTIEGADAAPAQFAWGQPVTIWQNRTAVRVGGSIFFQGYVAEIKRVATGGRQSIQYSIYGPWWLLERQRFKQTRQAFAGWVVPNDPTSGVTLVTALTTEIYLGEKADGTYQTNGQQIIEVLNWLNECYNPTKMGATSGRNNAFDVVQIGTIDPAANIPKTRVNEISCAEAINNVMRWSPDCVCWFDYTTSPPTFNARAQANLAAVALTITEEQAKEVQLSPQYSRQLPGVILYYKRTDMINGRPWIRWYTEYADGHGWGQYLGYGATVTLLAGPGGQQITDYTPDVASHTIELQGGNETIVSCNIVSIPLAAALDGINSDAVAFWQTLDKTLTDPCVDQTSITIPAATLTDDEDNPVDGTTFGYVLVTGQIPPWLTTDWVSAKLNTTYSYNRYADAGHVQPCANVTGKEVHHKVILCNVPSGLYQTISSSTSAEPVPIGLANSIYQSLATLQHAGTLVFAGQNIRQGLGVGQNLTAIGPNNTYTNLLVQSVRAVPHAGILTVTFGPSARLDAPELIELRRATMLRTMYNMPSNRATGQGSGNGSQVQLGDATARENTQHGLGSYSMFGVTAPASGANGPVNVVLDSADVTAAVPAGDNVKLGVIHWTDATGTPPGNSKYALIPLGTPHADLSPTTAIGPNTNIFVGGGGLGGQPALMALQGVLSDYVVGWRSPLPVTSITSAGTVATVTTASPHGLATGAVVNAKIAGATPSAYNGTFSATVTGPSTFAYAVPSGTASPATGTITYQADIYVAKNWKLRNSRTAETGADGTVYSLSYSAGPDANNILRVKTGASGPGIGNSEAEVVSPEWLVGDIFYALPAATGVNDGNGNPINFIIAGESRNWTAVAS